MAQVSAVSSSIRSVKLGESGGIMDELISVEEAARRLGGISKWTIFSWLSQGKLIRTKVGSRTMLRQSELDKVIQHGGKSLAPKRTRG
jgi:excisionase family DNA binding protein